MRKKFGAIVPILVLFCAQIAVAGEQEAVWTIVLQPHDIIIGDALKRLHTRHTWVDGFDDRSGAFEVAVRKGSVAIAAPRCHMDYLILKIPFYYPENPKQASISERHAIYDALVRLQARGSGSVAARVEAPPGFARLRAHRVELSSCELLFALPLSVQPSTQ
jgi:hypothetical protein